MRLTTLKLYGCRKMSFLSAPGVLLTPVRYMRCKPWLPKFRLIRKMQPFVQPFDPDQIFLGGKTGAGRSTSSEVRQNLRRNGLMPPLVFQDRPLNLTHSGRSYAFSLEQPLFAYVLIDCKCFNRANI